MIKRRAERRSEFGMHFLLYPGGNQVGDSGGCKQFLREGQDRVKRFLIILHDGPRE